MTDAPFTLLVCGGRDYADTKCVDRVLRRLFARRGQKVLLHGGATGADQLADDWARTRSDIEVIICTANWERWGRNAGPIRNAQMLLLEPDAVVAFPGGRGTADMVRRAREAGIPVVEVE